MTKATPKTHRKGAGRVAFLARADLFRSLVDAGHPQRSIYDDYAADLGISYSQFNRYVGKYLLGKAPDHEHQKGASPTPEPSAGPVTAPPAASTEAAGSGSASGQKRGGPSAKGGSFVHNPNSGNNRDDLV